MSKENTKVMRLSLNTIKEIDRIQEVLSKELGIRVSWRKAEVAHREKARTGVLPVKIRDKIMMGIIK